MVGCDVPRWLCSLGETYYREYIEDKFLHSLHAKKYCSSCHEKHGKDLLLNKR